MRRLNGWGILPALAVALALLAMFLAAGDQGLPLRLENEMLDLRFARGRRGVIACRW